MSSRSDTQREQKDLQMEEGRKVIVAENMSSNGVIEFVDDWFHPGDQDDTALLAVMNEHMATEDALLFGRKTFEDFRDYWSRLADDHTGFTAHMNSVQKYVFSRTLDDPGWEKSTVLRGSVETEVTALKEQPGRDIGITGSIAVVHALMRADLVDEYRLFVYPALTSRGRNLVPDGMDMGRLSLSGTYSFPSGVALLTYSRASCRGTDAARPRNSSLAAPRRREPRQERSQADN
jgi:dihydrofolate reductase